MRTLSQSTRALLASLTLAAFVVRALIPSGFMPSSLTPLALEICPEGFPAQLLGHAAHHHGGGGHGAADHCEFGGASPGPLAEPGAPPVVLSAQPPPTPRAAPRLIIVRLVYLPAARGPPSA
jgi:hypothetical protein